MFEDSELLFTSQAVDIYKMFLTKVTTWEAQAALHHADLYKEYRREMFSRVRYTLFSVFHTVHADTLHSSHAATSDWPYVL